MVSICFYFQVHQPFRMRKYSVFDISNNHYYWDDEKNKEILERVSRKCYLPTNNILMEWIKKYNVKVSFSFSGVVLEQFEKYYPEVLKSFQKLIKTGNVEVLSETYHHSLAFLYSKEEFKKQVELHKNKVEKLFGVTPKVFRNTELVYTNDLAKFVENMGYKGILLEGWDTVLGWRSPNFLYKPVNTSKIKALLKNYKLSDDIAFRFSNRSWSEWPLTADKFAQWVSNTNGNGNVVNLFMDYETFGEHQWEDTGIFDFLRHLPEEILKNPDNNFKTPSEVIDSYNTVGDIDVPHLLSWADLERDTSAWLGNKMQQSAADQIYSFEKEILSSKDEALIEDWRKLQTTDHLYYMCTKWFSDGDVHKYFNPYDSPYDSFIAYMNILGDLSVRLKEISKPEISEKKVLPIILEEKIVARKPKKALVSEKKKPLKKKASKRKTSKKKSRPKKKQTKKSSSSKKVKSSNKKTPKTFKDFTSETLRSFLKDLKKSSESLKKSSEKSLNKTYNALKDSEKSLSKKYKELKKRLNN